MPSQTTPTVATTIRLFSDQKEQLKSLPDGISCSILARILFQLYLDGRIPEAVPLILAEAERAEQAKKDSQFD